MVSWDMSFLFYWLVFGLLAWALYALAVAFSPVTAFLSLLGLFAFLATIVRPPLYQLENADSS
jgi:hypothetical protein